MGGDCHIILPLKKSTLCDFVSTSYLAKSLGLQLAFGKGGIWCGYSSNESVDGNSGYHNDNLSNKLVIFIRGGWKGCTLVLTLMLLRYCRKIKSDWLKGCLRSLAPCKENKQVLDGPFYLVCSHCGCLLSEWGNIFIWRLSNYQLIKKMMDNTVSFQYSNKIGGQML